MGLPDREETIAKVRAVLLKSGIAIGTVARNNAASIDSAVTDVLKQLPYLRWVPRKWLSGVIVAAINTLPDEKTGQPALDIPVR